MIKAVPRQKKLSESEVKALEKLSSNMEQTRCEVPVGDSGTGGVQGTAGGSIEFDVTWFDMPLTDNTLEPVRNFVCGA